VGHHGEVTHILISAEELADALAGPQPPVVLDVRWVAGKVDRDGYLAGHIPGAVFLDLDADLAAPPGQGGRHPLPEPQRLQDVWRRAGINPDSTVVVYDTKDSSIAARAWWLLKWSGVSEVRVLDGGFAAWARQGGQVETGESPLPEPGTVTVAPGGMATVTADEVEHLASGPGVLLDGRAAARYRGEEEPLDPIAGHIPGAVNLPLTELVNPDGTFRSAAELWSIFDKVIGTGDVVASCGSGVTACHLILAGALIGRPMELYPGSYSGWLALGREVTVGPEPWGSAPGQH
jgi:thiosulfate/3-mercaptopyruvate sulfurtransferase